MEIKVVVDSALIKALNNLANALNGNLGSIQTDLKGLSDSVVEQVEEKTSLAQTTEIKDPQVKKLTLEDVRTKLADVSRAGKQAQVRDLILKYGSNNLTGIDPKHYASLLADVETL